jgi:hypothetical protein
MSEQNLPVAANASDTRARSYRDCEGVTWNVRERTVRHRAAALYFESASAVRRVTHYPVDWFILENAQLERLSHES